MCARFDIKLADEMVEIEPDMIKHGLGALRSKFLGICSDQTESSDGLTMNCKIETSSQY